jgi:hypothetical protein
VTGVQTCALPIWQCPLVLPINVGWKQNKVFGILEGSVLANGPLGGAAEGRIWTVGLGFVFGVQTYYEISKILVSLIIYKHPACTAQ